MGSFVAHGSSYWESSGAHHRMEGWGMPEPWEADAACRDSPIEWWFGEEKPFGDKGPLRTRKQTAKAKAICARCPVLDDCRQWVMAVKLPYGVVAAMTETERQRLLDEGEEAWGKFWKQQDRELGRTSHNTRKTHCNHGHPYNEENTYVSGGKRFCLACQKRRTAEYRVRKRKELGHWPWEDWPSTRQRRNGHKAD
jgi:WhiB family redox-sensing transcriptional regulator